MWRFTWEAPGGPAQHRHHLNPRYDGVVLHAYLRREADGHVARNSRGEAIEGFHMEPSLFPDLETIRQTVQVEDYPYQTPSAIGRCQPLMCSLDVDFVGELLEAAGRERIETKAARFDDQSLGETLEQVLYQALMTSMGHKANKGLFFLLSKRAPLAELADYLRDIGRDRAVPMFQALLLHIARLAPDATGDADAETADYLARIGPIWERFHGYFSDRLIPPTRQWITGVRACEFRASPSGRASPICSTACSSTKAFSNAFSRAFPRLTPKPNRARRSAGFAANWSSRSSSTRPTISGRTATTSRRSARRVR